MGVSCLAGAAVPVLPVILGAQSVLLSLLVAGTMIVVVSTPLAFLSGMDVRRRIAMNLVIIAAAVGVPYLIGVLTRGADFDAVGREIGRCPVRNRIRQLRI